MKLPRSTYWTAAIIFSLSFILDVWTKLWAAGSLTRGRSITIVDGFLEFTLVHNRGAAFGMGAQWSTYFFIAVTLIAVGVVIHLFLRLRPEERLSAWGLAFILSGAVGNLIDRFRFRYVVDFILVHLPKEQCPTWIDRVLSDCHWPVFNVADAAITVGVALYAIDMLRMRQAKTDQANESGLSEE